MKMATLSKIEKKALKLVKKKEFKLFSLADEIREKNKGKEVTYVVNRNINYTNKCGLNCSFCSFSKEKNYILSTDEILEKVEEAKEKNASEVCLQGGINKDLKRDYYFELVEKIKENYNIHLHAFSPQEINHIAEDSIKETLVKLKRKGLDSIPGTAAEMLVEDVRQEICPNKISSKKWVEIIKTAHKLGIPTTATMLYGHEESWMDRIRHILKIKKIQEETGGFTEFIPLPFLPGNNKLGKQNNGTLSIEDFKVIALSRVLLKDQIDNIQASWLKLGKEDAKKSLYFGANDLGGTLMEENISKSTGLVEEIPSKNDMHQLIREADRKPVERTTLYDKIG
ncbi:MAG: Thiamine biosynthesis enzyme ThiH, FO synthase [Candidatus Methanohalarchaeum thermophilum]|uniref:5-amino-6-(D-ribitylamino)uracil--L-tyrosine 4-hydroxyphenyl transferase n=1 Tax=Methanohalarchaeum thermophilum TaxID=1903181 RepID=A0A1Q6DTP3_METT1|nr:MAG: Thiamine biosynthesis enzyme ThiH, FO synthase [Candidatus Methanohalarchaeum thermophilum]